MTPITEPTVQYLILAAAVTLLLSGLALQSFIVVMNLSEKLKGGLMVASNQIITTLGVSRFIFHCVCCWKVFQFSFLVPVPTLFSHMVDLIGFTSVSSSVWLSALLSITLCLKVSNFKHVYLVRLGALISRKATFLIAACMLWPFAYSFANVILLHHINPNNSTEVKMFNSQQYEMIAIFTLMWTSGPLLIFFSSSLLSIVPLWLHMRNIMSSGDAVFSTDIYIWTIVINICAMVTCAIGIIVILLGGHYTAFIDFVGIYVMCNAFPVLHSIYIIYATAKLRNAFHRMVWQGSQCLFIKWIPESKS